VTQKEMIKRLSVATDFAQKDIRIVLAALGKVVEEAVKEEPVKGVVEIPGVIRLKVVKTKPRKERQQWNSILQKDVTIPFKPSQITVRPVLDGEFKKAVTRDA
jgi:nucleoid DNA-binding protein